MMRDNTRLKKIIKMFLFDMAIVIADIFCISKLLFGHPIKEYGTILVALFATVIVVSIPSFFYFNFKTLIEKKYKYNMEDLDEDYEFVEAFLEFKKHPEFIGFVDTCIKQLNSLDNKINTIIKVLVQNYNEGIEEFSGLNNVVEDSKSVIYQNMRDIINRLTIFDTTDYSSRQNIIDESIFYEKKNMQAEQTQYIKGVINSNEVILLELDKLMVEATKLKGNNTSQKEIDNIKDIVSSLQKMQEDNSSIESKYGDIMERLDNDPGADLSQQEEGGTRVE